MIITEKQQREIEQLIPKHKDALVAFGADMYRRGFINGAIWLGAGVCFGFALEGSIQIYKYWKSQKKNDEES